MSENLHGQVGTLVEETVNGLNILMQVCFGDYVFYMSPDKAREFALLLLQETAVAEYRVNILNQSQIIEPKGDA
jgi:hypothetical protein